jgi:uncharacterized membrane protein
MSSPQPAAKSESALDPFRRAIVRGLGILLPPLLTIVIILWVWNTVADYLLVPLENAARTVLVDHHEKSILPADSVPADQPVKGRALVNGVAYRQTADGQYIPAADYDEVAEAMGKATMPPTADGVYQVFVERKYLQRRIVVPIFLCVFVLLLYLLGKFLAAGIGRFFWTLFERGVTRLPLIRNVYSSVKQVTDFMFNETEIAYTRIVAVEYPRKGVWQLAFVTGESLLDLACAANEPVLAVLIPTSPMPFTGFTATVKRSETIDLNITMEQALQFIMSCGVVTPPQQGYQASMFRQAPVTPPLPSLPPSSET